MNSKNYIIFFLGTVIVLLCLVLFFYSISPYQREQRVAREFNPKADSAFRSERCIEISNDMVPYWNGTGHFPPDGNKIPGRLLEVVRILPDRCRGELE